MNTLSLQEFARTCTVYEIGQRLSPDMVDKTMVISILLAQIIDHYKAYDAAVQPIEITLGDVLNRLSEPQRSEVASSVNKQAKIMKAVRQQLAEFKHGNQRIIADLEKNKAQVVSAGPKAQLHLENLLRQMQGRPAVKRLPGKKKAVK